ncbi:kinase-like domain-containing protein [Glomus cerebriforme]|uniref:Kinase-like domain-containing protein n=1 Tax=Glomus cerebriforme TaxID=658196 RepID=A0A397SHP9_9GLOM|nr:kinase-like domain-containing protein [Glomus cerebriforme]
MDECKGLESNSSIRNRLTVVDTHRVPTLGTRKPDLVFIPNGSHLDMLNAVVIGEVKKRTGENFGHANIGQAVSFGEKTLQLQPRRSFVYVVLTDCLIINIYRVTRVDRNNNHTQFKYDHVAPQNLGYGSPVSKPSNGWKYLVTILESSPEELGWVEPTLKFDNETIKLVRSVGVGRTSVVYKGTLSSNNVSVAVKMAKKADYLSCFEREKNVLEELSSLNSLHIPKILFSNDNTLVMTPFCEKINNLQKKDIRDIIITLQNVHGRGIIHRDLRKFNFLRNLGDLDKNILIVDWGYSTNNSESTSSFAGALECMPDYVLQSLISDEEITYEPRIDLICFVRSFYLMLHRPSLDRIPFDKADDIKQRAGMLLNFWGDCGQSDVWDNIL